MDLQEINLIVGRNASGKSRTLNLIYALSQCLMGRRAPTDGNFEFGFRSSTGQNSTYELRVLNAQVVHEVFKSGEQTLLERGEGGVGRIFAEQFNTYMNFQASPAMLAANTRNDNIQHPFLKPLMDWAERLYYYPCTTDLGKSALAIIREGAPPVDPRDANQTTGVLKAGIKQFGTEFVNSVLEDMRTVGYHLSEVGVTAPTSIQILGPGEAESVYVVEDGIPAKLDQFVMSVGMFRALAIIIHLNFGIRSSAADSVLIDDIGEGLDFDRSSNLIHLIVKKVKNSSLQVIMTTNDRYVMNGIPLDYWSVLDRDGGEVTSYNMFNRREVFEDFKFTGLSNFDFLARDFLAND
ncbi:ATP-binding protein [Agrobacterium tumefaciens]|nr:ATP-binding protein [Agrobacterium tumefaciens]